MADSQPNRYEAKPAGQPPRNRSSLYLALLTTLGNGVTSFGGKVFNAPFSVISMISKVDQELVRQNRLDRPYTGPIDAATRILAAEGISGLWRGFLINIPGYYVVPALNFASKNYITRTLFRHSPKDSYMVQFTKGLFSGVVSGALSLALVHPFRITSFKNVTDVGGKYNGILSIWQDIFKTDGILGFFTGFGTQIAAVFLYRLLYFGAYDLYRTLVRKPKSQTEGFWLGWFSTVFAMAATYPLAVIQDRLMITAGSNIKYSSMSQMFNEIYRKEGLLGFWRGFAISFAINSGVGAARALFDYAKTYIWRKSPHA